MSDLQGGPLVDIMVLLLNSRSKKPEQHHKNPRLYRGFYFFVYKMSIIYVQIN